MINNPHNGLLLPCAETPWDTALRHPPRRTIGLAGSMRRNWNLLLLRV